MCPGRDLHWDLPRSPHGVIVCVCVYTYIYFFISWGHFLLNIYGDAARFDPKR